MNSNTSTSWFVAGILFIILLVVGFMWINTKRELESVLAENSQDIRSQRAVIAEKCAGKEKTAECDLALEELAAILREFDSELSAATTSAETR